MRERPSARLLIVDSDDRLLLFKFVFPSGPMAGTQFWATPGGGLDPGESYEAAACREMFEETGLRIEHPGAEVARRLAVFPLIDGEMVRADERFFLIRVDRLDISSAHWTEIERDVMRDARWWSLDELRATDEQVYPEELVQMLIDAKVFRE